METKENLSEFNFITIQKLLQYIFGTISCFSNLIIIISYLFSRGSQLFTFELIFCLTISSLITNLSYFILFIDDDTNYNYTLCRIQSFVQIFSETSVIIFAMIISVHCYISIKNYYLIDHIENRKKFTRFITLSLGFGLPLIISSIFQILNVVGVSEIWCWIDQNRLITQIIYLSSIWLLLIASTIFACMAINVNQKIRDFDSVHKLNYVRSLYLYPIVCYITWFVATFDRLSYYITNRSNRSWNNFIILVDITVFQLQGACYGSIFLYFNQKKVKEIASILWRKIKKCSCCFKKQIENNDDLENFIETEDVLDMEIDSYIRNSGRNDINGSNNSSNNSSNNNSNNNINSNDFDKADESFRERSRTEQNLNITKDNIAERILNDINVSKDKNDFKSSIKK